MIGIIVIALCILAFVIWILTHTGPHYDEIKKHEAAKRRWAELIGDKK